MPARCGLCCVSEKPESSSSMLHESLEVILHLHPTFCMYATYVTERVAVRISYVFSRVRAWYRSTCIIALVPDAYNALVEFVGERTLLRHSALLLGLTGAVLRVNSSRSHRVNAVTNSQ
jgi:hypothetical protein